MFLISKGHNLPPSRHESGRSLNENFGVKTGVQYSLGNLYAYGIAVTDKRSLKLTTVLTSAFQKPLI